MKPPLQNFILELFFPSFCLGCKKEGTMLCQDCVATLDINEYDYCLCNQHPLRLLQGNLSGTCAKCSSGTLSGLYSALAYKDRALTKKLIYQFKYEPYLKNLAKPLAEIILTHLARTKTLDAEIWKDSVFIPMPLHISKQKDRGYNQAEELAKELAHHILIPISSGNLVKIKKTVSQTDLSAKERQENIRNTFAIKNPAEFANKKIFLVDDVYTTGATMQECARTLRQAGAKQVWGIAIAREG